jgi:TPR repeat protein
MSQSSSHFGKLHPATASAYNNVGLMNKCLGHYIDAKQAYEEALRIYGEVCGKDHGSYAAAMRNLGMLEGGRVLKWIAKKTMAIPNRVLLK